MTDRERKMVRKEKNIDTGRKDNRIKTTIAPPWASMIRDLRGEHQKHKSITPPFSQNAPHCPSVTLAPHNPNTNQKQKQKKTKIKTNRRTNIYKLKLKLLVL